MVRFLPDGHVPVTNTIWLEDSETGEQFILDGGDGQDSHCDVKTDPWWLAFRDGCAGQSRSSADEWLDEHTDIGRHGWEPRTVYCDQCGEEISRCECDC